jgi:DNA-directed RNA polymerase subunit RPC12/RpoP
MSEDIMDIPYEELTCSQCGCKIFSKPRHSRACGLCGSLELCEEWELNGEPPANVNPAPEPEE